MNAGSFGSYDPMLASAIIKEFEGCSLTAYKCSAGVWTIGYGHTGRDIGQGDTITESQADDFLREDLESVQKRLSHYVNRHVTGGQFIALMSLAFNVGVGAVARSKLLKKFNSGNVTGSAMEFLDFNLVNGQPSKGLTRRRQAEYSLFLGEIE